MQGGASAYTHPCPYDTPYNTTVSYINCHCVVVTENAHSLADSATCCLTIAKVVRSVPLPRGKTATCIFGGCGACTWSTARKSISDFIYNLYEGVHVKVNKRRTLLGPNSPIGGATCVDKSPPCEIRQMCTQCVSHREVRLYTHTSPCRTRHVYTQCVP